MSIVQFVTQPSALIGVGLFLIGLTIFIWGIVVDRQRRR